MSNQDDRSPQPSEPPVRTETPESRMTGEGSPPPREEEKRPADGPEYAITDPAPDESAEEPADEPEPQEPPD